MKYLLLLLFVGLASAASFYGVSHDVDDETARQLLAASSFMDVLHVDELASEGDDGTERELVKKYREVADKILQKIKDAFEKGETVKEGLLEKFKELKQKLKDFKSGISEKGKELLQKIREHVKDFMRKLLEKLEEKDKERRSDFNIRDLFKTLRDYILEHFNEAGLKEKFEKLLEKYPVIAEQIRESIKRLGEKWKQKLLDFLNRILEDDQSPEKRSISEVWKKIKEYFDKVQIIITEKYMKFGEWVKEKVGGGLDSAKSKIENIKRIAQEFRDHAKNVTKDVAAEALEFLKPYKEDLGSLWDQVRETVKEVLSRKD